MPQLKSAAKQLRRSRKRADENKKIKERLRKLTKDAKNSKDLPAINKLTDKATKRGIFHKNKAARMKSSLAKKLRKH
jgi:small subunit ribosomal protein S20